MRCAGRMAGAARRVAALLSASSLLRPCADGARARFDPYRDIQSALIKLHEAPWSY
jgi:hypothetical protein